MFFCGINIFLEGRERLQDDNREGRPISAMLITFFDSKEIIHRKFVSTGQTVTRVYYFEVLKCMMDRMDPLFINFWLEIKSVC